MVLRILDCSEVPIYLQIRNQIVAGISDGRLARGESLPPVRVLASEIGVNAMTVNKAYQMLRQEGFILIDRRRGARVAESGGGDGELPREVLEKLGDLAAETRARGMSKGDFLALCGELYDGEAESW